LIITTVTSAAFLPKAVVMAQSAKRHIPKCTIVIGLIEESVPESAHHLPCVDEIVLGKDMMGYADFHRFLFQYYAEEGINSCKPQLLNYVYKKYDRERKFVYMDTDMYVMSDLEELDDHFKRHAVLLTPHYVESPEPFIAEKLLEWEARPFEIGFFRSYGIINGGFLALKRHPSAEKFIQWWMRRVEQYGFFDYEKGLFSDQYWLQYASAFFDDILFLRHPGYNFAPWNWQERRASAAGDTFLASNEPIRLFHMSGVNSHFDKWNEQLPDDQQKIMNDIREIYLQELNNVGFSDLKWIEWCYNFYSSGERIEHKARIVFRGLYKNQELPNPFSLSNAFFLTEEPPPTPDPPAPNPAIAETDTRAMNVEADNRARHAEDFLKQNMNIRPNRYRKQFSRKSRRLNKRPGKPTASRKRKAPSRLKKSAKKIVRWLRSPPSRTRRKAAPRKGVNP